MATIDLTTLTRFNLTEEERISGSILTIQQQQVIQNQIAQVAEERLALSFDPLNPVKFAQQDAELKGQIGALKYLLAVSDESVKEVANAANPQEQQY